MTALPSDDPDDFTSGCSNPSCICSDPHRWPVCEEWMGIPETGRYCPRCGWVERLHPPAVIRTSVAAHSVSDAGSEQ